MKLVLAAADAAKAVVTSLAAAPPVLFAAPNVAGIAALAMVSATSALNIAKISKSTYKGSPAPVATPPTLNISASQPGLTTDTLSSSSNNEGIGSESVGDGAGQNQIIKAIVVESDITEAQNNVAGFEEASEIG